MKTNSTFNLSKSSKRILASNRYADPIKAAEFKRFAISCEVAEERARFAKVDKQSKE